MLKHYVLFLFDLVHCYAYVPTVLKPGIILTLYIQVETVIRIIIQPLPFLRLCWNYMKRVLFRGLHVSIDKPLHSFQGDFQSNMGRWMTSFVLKESIQYFRKANIKPVLNARQAFNRVWHDGFFYKLRELGVQLKLLKSVIFMRSNMNSCVVYIGHFSDCFPVGVCICLHVLCWFGSLLLHVGWISISITCKSEDLNNLLIAM